MRDVVVAMLAGALLGAGVFYWGFRVGRKAGNDDTVDAVVEAALRLVDPKGEAGRLPSEQPEQPTEKVPPVPIGETTGRHHKTADDPTPPGGFSLRLGPRHDTATDRFSPLAPDSFDDPGAWRPSPHPREVTAP